jgi:hypothetical protein
MKSMVTSLTSFGRDWERDDERMRLAASEIDQLCPHLDCDTATSANTARSLQRLRQHMRSLPPLLATIEGLLLLRGIGNAKEPAEAPSFRF